MISIKYLFKINIGSSIWNPEAQSIAQSIASMDCLQIIQCKKKGKVFSSIHFVISLTFVISRNEESNWLLNENDTFDMYQNEFLRTISELNWIFPEKSLISVIAFFELVRYTSLLFILCHFKVKDIIFSLSELLFLWKATRYSLSVRQVCWFFRCPNAFFIYSWYLIENCFFWSFFYSRLHWILGKNYHSLIERFLLDDWKKIHDVFFNSPVIFFDIIISGDGSLRILLDSRFLSMSISGDAPPIWHELSFFIIFCVPRVLHYTKWL